MRIMIVGHGAREHAIARRLVRDGHEVVTYACRPNVGLKHDCHDFVLAPKYSAKSIVTQAVARKVDLLLPTDEAALFGGVGDAARAAGLLCFGHLKKTALLLEGMRNEVMAVLPSGRYARVPEGKLVTTHRELHELVVTGEMPVVKPLFADAPAGRVAFLDGDGAEFIDQLEMPVWAEAYRAGVDFSIHYLVSGAAFHFLGMTFDYPFLGNRPLVLTGGMGAVVPGKRDASLVSGELLRECQTMVEVGLRRLQEKHGCELNGFVSAQFRKHRQQAIFTELDCKPGNPEFIALLPTLHGDLGVALDNMARGVPPDLSSYGTASVAISMAPAGYPQSVAADAHDIPADLLLHGEVLIGESRKWGGAIKSGRSRTLCVVFGADDIRQARDRAAWLAAEIGRATGLMFRDDIGDNLTRPAAAQRVQKSLRALKEKGGKRFMLRLSPEAHAALRTLVPTEAFPNETLAINTAIINLASQTSAA